MTRLLALAAFALRVMAAQPDQAALNEFQSHLSAYVKLHEKAKSGLPTLKPTPSPESITEHERALAHRIREAREREHVLEGNIFTPKVAAEFKRLIAETMKGSEGVSIKQSLASGEPVQLGQIRVNQPYPKGVPVQNTPPTLLLNLPKLPQGYSYRVVNGSLLILYDSEANLVVDVLPNAIPQ